MTFQEINSALRKALQGEPEKLAYLGHGEIANKYPEIQKLGTVKLNLDQEGGEGEGEHWHTVHHFTDHDVYVRVDGWYQSHHGTEFHSWDDSVSEVRPMQRMVTFYE